MHTGITISLQAAVADDRRWFSRNPHRRHRIRMALPGDGPGGGWIIVRQVEPGVRVRLLVDLASPPASDEETARRLFEQAMQCNDLAGSIFEQVELALGGRALPAPHLRSTVSRGLIPESGRREGGCDTRRNLSA